VTSTEPVAATEMATPTSKLVSVARWASLSFLVVALALGLLSGWCAMRISEMRCGPEPPEPHTGLYLILVAPPIVATLLALVLVRRAFNLRTGAAASAALVAAMVGCALGAGSVVFAALVAMSC
jgi:hypothetical protein